MPSVPEVSEIGQSFHTTHDIVRQIRVDQLHIKNFDYAAECVSVIELDHELELNRSTYTSVELCRDPITVNVDPQFPVFLGMDINVAGHVESAQGTDSLEAELVSFPYMGDEGFSTMTVEIDDISVRIRPVWKLDPFLIAQTGTEFVECANVLRGKCCRKAGLSGAIDEAD